jgi:hypothetical protein
MQEDGIVSNSMTTRAAELFRQAAGQGRSALDAGELKALLDGLGLVFDAAAPAGAVDVRISLNSTREFGMVVSAGLGGWKPSSTRATSAATALRCMPPRR